MSEELGYIVLTQDKLESVMKLMMPMEAGLFADTLKQVGKKYKGAKVIQRGSALWVAFANKPTGHRITPNELHRLEEEAYDREVERAWQTIAHDYPEDKQEELRANLKRNLRRLPK